MRRIVLFLLFLLMIASAQAEQTRLTTTVPSKHTITFQIGEHGAVQIGDTIYKNGQSVTVQRFDSLEIKLVPDIGYLTDTVSASYGDFVTFDADSILLSKAVQNETLTVSYVQNPNPFASVMWLSASHAVLPVGAKLSISIVLPEEKPLPASVVWSSSDPNVARVDRNGTISTVSNGNAVITAVSGTLSASCTLEVQAMNQIVLPSMLHTLEKNAMAKNTAFEHVIIGKNTEHIGIGAFKNCSNLKLVTIPSSVYDFGADCFSGCPNMVILCNPDSAVLLYAKQNGIPYLINQSP